jgi:hypothetical protein
MRSDLVVNDLVFRLDCHRRHRVLGRAAVALLDLQQPVRVFEVGVGIRHCGSRAEQLAEEGLHGRDATDPDGHVQLGSLDACKGNDLV